MNLKNQAINSSLIPVIVIALCFLIGKGIADVPSQIPILIVISVGVFFLAFTQFDFALILLIYAMLLSPEMAMGAVGKRAIVIRIEDLLIIVFFMVYLARTTVNKKMRVIPRTPLNKYIALYLLICVISTVKGIMTNVVAPAKGIFYVLKYVEYFLIFYIATGLIHSKDQIKSFLKAIIITFAIVNIYAFTQIGIEGRVTAPFEGEEGEPNTLGGYQVLILGIIIGLITHIPASPWKLPLIGLSLFSMIPFVYTLSRSSYVALVPMYLTLIYFNKTRKRNVLIAILIVATILSIFFFPQNVKKRITATFTPEYQENIKTAEIFGVELGPSASARLQDWGHLFEDWKGRPFMGYGITGRGFLDSQFIRTLVELGLLGMVSFLLLLIAVFRSTLTIYKNTEDELLKGLALGFLAGHLGMITHAITANTFILIRIMEPYWFLAAMVMVIPKIEQSKKLRKIKEEKEGSAMPRNSLFLLNYANTRKV